jgi:hypothetical protein
MSASDRARRSSSAASKASSLSKGSTLPARC